MPRVVALALLLCLCAREGAALPSPFAATARPARRPELVDERVLRDTDSLWLQYLNDPPASAVALANSLSARADAVVHGLLNSSSPLAVSGDVDVVCSGGGNLDAYYLGVAMVMRRVQEANPRAAAVSSASPRAVGAGRLQAVRFAGASAGGMMPYELVLKGENTTVTTHLSYGVLTAQFPEYFSHDVVAVFLQDHHWRLMSTWQMHAFEGRLVDLNGRVFVAMSCWTPWLELVMVSNYTAQDDQAAHAFMATGTFMEHYNSSLWCSDGGTASGKKMTPLFQDHVRPQVIVDLMETGEPASMALRINTTQYADLIRKGQDEAADFLRTGECRASAISLCPTTATTSANVCDLGNAAPAPAIRMLQGP